MACDGRVERLLVTLLWRHQSGADRYEVRRAGRAIRLYSNGVFHTQWNPARPLAGSVWDLLALPSLFLAHAAPRILVLGLGGGAVVRQLSMLKPGAEIVAVELDPVHIGIAHRWFGVGGHGERVCLADATAWVSAYRGARFDYVVDDLFGHRDGEAARAVRADRRWGRAIASLLAPDGIFVVNHADQREWRACALRAAGYTHRRRAALPLYDNVIGVYRRSRLDLDQWDAALQQCNGLGASQQRIARRGRAV